MKRMLSIALTVALLTTAFGGAVATPVAAEETYQEGDDTDVDGTIEDILSDNVDDLLSGNNVIVSDLLNLDAGDNDDDPEGDDSLLGVL